jgi:hypothetical protein
MRKPLRILLAVVSAVAVVAVTGTAIAAGTGATGSPSGFLDSVAKHLGISREKLDEATKAAALEQVDAALEAGRITEEQADAMKERIESGEGGFMFGLGFGHHGGHGFGGHGFVDTLGVAAEYLGLEEDELRERLREGASLAEVAKDEGKSVDGLKQALLADAKERVAAAVKDGKLTEEQAEEALTRLEERIDDIVAGTGRLHRGFRGGGPGLRWGPPAGMRGDPAAGAPVAPAWGAPA